jgi:lipopolysaccharide transport system ATP-binding protein
VTRYLELARNDGKLTTRPDTRPGTGAWRFTAVDAKKQVFEPAEPKVFRFEAAPMRNGAGRAFLSAHVMNSQGTVIAQLDSRLLGTWLSGSQPIRGELRIDSPWLKPGRYGLDLFLCAPNGVIDLFERALEFEISPILPYPESVKEEATATGQVLASFCWNLEE